MNFSLTDARRLLGRGIIYLPLFSFFKITYAQTPEETTPKTLSSKQSPEYYGDFVPGVGFQVANTDHGALNFSAYTYVRYLNQSNLDDTYTDSFGRTSNIDIRNDFQVQKVMLYFKGWVHDPNLHYLLYTWTSNTSQGDPAQVVVAGNISYHFSDAFNLSAGIMGLPTSRSMEGQWPSYLKVDYRTIADEFFRGSYTTGIFAGGQFAQKFQYKVMIGNNLSQLGVSASQLDDRWDTLSGGLWWMPTTGEYGPGQGFGDFEHHSELATRLGIHFTHSTETEQSQPGTEAPENSQIKLSDGTAVFSADAFGPGIQVEQARYQMMAIDGGLKWQGFSLEGEIFRRWVDDFKANAILPIDELNDEGYQLQASMMVLPKKLQAYVATSKIFGEYGNPYDFSVGVNWFPQTDNQKWRVNSEFLYLNNSPVGYSSVPFTTGGNGTVFVTNLELAM